MFQVHTLNSRTIPHQRRRGVHRNGTPGRGVPHVQLIVGNGWPMRLRMQARTNAKSDLRLSWRQRRGSAPASEHNHPRRSAPSSPAVPSTGAVGIGCCPHQSHPYRTALGRPTPHQESRVKPARRSSRFIYPKTAAQGLHQSRLLLKTKTPRTGNIGPGLTGGSAPSASEPARSQRSSDLLWERDFPGASNPP
jgi:hypothetical protein